MNDFIDALQNTITSKLAAPVSRGVVQAIHQASENTGIDFSYLVQQAKAESSFNPEAKAKTSSASGLFQFIESTWMNMVERYGAKHGIDATQDKQDLLSLREDPEIASTMAAEFAGENQRILKKNWGGDVGATELYFAHFLGAGQATAFLKAKDASPLDPAATLFPKAAEANKAVFFDKTTGRARSVAEVYAYFDRKFDNSFDMPAAQPAPSTKMQVAELPTAQPKPSIDAAPSVAQKDQVMDALMQLLTLRDQSMVHLTQMNWDRFNDRGETHETFAPIGGLVYNHIDLMLLTQRA